ncbi:MAG: hypothetical protein IJU76_14830 [Desulfovibrionaceae bacterium]|nr:hypothetical protein [Desulfovibrionaceae bacterium]
MRTASSGSPTYLSGASRKLAADRHEEILNTIKETRNQQSNQTVIPNVEIKKTSEHVISDSEHAEIKLIDPEIFGLKNIKEKQLKLLSQSLDTIQRLADAEIIKEQKINEKEISILTRKLDALIAKGTKTQAEKNEILDRCKDRQSKDMDALRTKLSSTLDLVSRNRSIAVA